MNDYIVFYGNDLRTLCSWECEANTEFHAKSLFRGKFGYNSLKIQYVKMVN